MTAWRGWINADNIWQENWKEKKDNQYTNIWLACELNVNYLKYWFVIKTAIIKTALQRQIELVVNITAAASAQENIFMNFNGTKRENKYCSEWNKSINKIGELFKYDSH